MIYLIGGPPRCGKTTIAKESSKLWISVDTIESVILSNTNKKDLNRLFPKTVVRKKTKQSNDIMYNSYSAKKITNLYKKQSKTSWEAIDTMINRELHEHNDYIIEGHQIHPEFINNIIKKYGGKNIISLVLTRFNLDEIVSGNKKYKVENNWFIQKTKNEYIFYKIAEMIKVYSNYYEKEAKKYGIKIINMDNDFLGQLKKSINYLKIK